MCLRFNLELEQYPFCLNSLVLQWQVGGKITSYRAGVGKARRAKGADF